MLYKVALISIVILLAVLSSYSVQAAPSVTLLETNGYLNSDGHYVVLGEVLNDGSVPLQFVEVIVEFFDHELNPLITLSSSIALEKIHQGQISPFAVILKDATVAPSVKSFAVTIGDLNPTDVKPAKLAVIFHKMEIVEGSIVVKGRIANDGTALSENTKAMVVLYNVFGEPVRYGFTFTDPRNILATSSGLFSIKFTVDNISSINGYSISSESSVYAETERIVAIQKPTIQRIEEVVNLSDLSVFDQNNRAANSIDVGEPALFEINLSNNILERLQYTYILQIKDQNDFVVSLSWSVGSLDVRESSTATIAWIPLEKGTYRAEAFVWKDINDPVPMAFRTQSESFRVT